MGFSRREFLTTAAAGSLAVGFSMDGQTGSTPTNQAFVSGQGKKPIIICANNGLNYLDEAYNLLRDGSD
ncbi:MAG: twin-arginine translocation signal domain-containing protein, partial [Acidobacteria bacterium]|nr:twin-arginine translocation signal domain-containing protein [Acidobacteriota bacterium]